MRLYVHYEPPEEALAWTKRVQVSLSSCPTVRVVVTRFLSEYSARFQRELKLEDVDVYTAFSASRARLETLEDALMDVDGAKNSEPLDKCGFELVLVPKRHEKSRLQVDKQLQLAAKLRQLKQVRAARDVYRELQEDTEALVALGDICRDSGKLQEAEELYHKCWGAKNKSKWVAAAAVRLTECLIERKALKRAVEVLHELATSGEASSLTEQVAVLRARALYETAELEKQDEAIEIVQRLLPDLQAPSLNLDALLLYARMAHDRGKKAEALNMALRVLVGKSTDRAAKKLFAGLMRDDGAMERLTQAVPPTSPSAGAAYAFMATILKDDGAVESSIACFHQAQQCNPHSASYALNHAHALEICTRYAEAYDVLVSFFRQNTQLGVGGAGKLLAGAFVSLLDQAEPWKEGGRPYDARVEWVEHENYARVIPRTQTSETMGSARVVPLDLETTSRPEVKASPRLSEPELDLLACFFTVVKILFIKGRLLSIPPLIQALEPLRRGRDLHLTTIRNEQAYYACIVQLLSIEQGLVLNPPVSPPEPADVVYVCGDSHTLATAWREIHVHHRRTILYPALVTGLKHWHLRKETTFYPKLNFWHVVATIPARSRVVFLFGEIDCREGILQAVDKCKYESVEEGIEHTIGIFMEALAQVVTQYEFEVYIHPVVPVLDETRAMVVLYNKLFQKRVARSRICTWLDLFDGLVAGVPLKLRPELRLDGTHLHPSYLASLAAALTRASPNSPGL